MKIFKSNTTNQLIDAHLPIVSSLRTTSSQIVKGIQCKIQLKNK